jgi:hypothetical protein
MMKYHRICLSLTAFTSALNGLLNDHLDSGVTGQQMMLTPPRHLIPPPVFPGVRVRPFVYLTGNSYMNFETDYSLVSWPLHTLNNS